jgi:hypothetical protein
MTIGALKCLFGIVFACFGMFGAWFLSYVTLNPPAVGSVNCVAFSLEAMLTCFVGLRLMLKQTDLE